MCELAVAMPVSGSFVTYAVTFISPSVACGVGWSYWFSWVAYIPAECIAGGIILESFTSINSCIWAVCFGLLITYININKIEAFGEIEFWLALIKLLALIGFIVISLLIFFGITHGSQQSSIIGGKFIFGQGGLFPNGGMSLLTSMVLMLVNYQGSEIVGFAAGESIKPSLIMPTAIRNITYRIILIYVVPTFCLVLIFPWQKASLAYPVFATALDFYGLRWASTVFSLVALTAALSCSNSGLYGIIRVLTALATHGAAPHKLGRLNYNAVPQNAAMVSLLAIWILLGASYFFKQSAFYVALLLTSGFTGMMAWVSICWSQINFRKYLRQTGYNISDLNYKTPASPYTGLMVIF